MPNIAAVLKSEIARLARKELREETQQFKKLSAQYRTQFAALRRRIDDLERQVARLRKGGPVRGARAAAAQEQPEAEDGRRGLRFSAKGLAAQRKRLGLSAAAMGALLGVTAQSVYKWEDGKARPRNSQLKAIAAVRGMGKRQAAARLAELGEQQQA